MHVLGSQRASVGQSPSALATLLGEQKGLVGRWLPSALTSMPGWSSLAPSASDVAATAARATTGWSWNRLVPILIVAGLALAGVAAWLANWQAPSPSAITSALTQVQLPGGVTISVPQSSFTYSLSQWLAGTDTATPRRFVFDNLNFETGTSRLTAESSATVNSLVAIMKAYPNVAVRLEGYKDNTGDPVANQTLSLERDNSVRSM